MRRLGLVVSMLVTVALLATPASGSAAHLTLSPSIGPPTLSISASGTGFGASEVVDLRFDTSLIGTAMTNGSGAFSTTITIPSKARPGSHSVKARGESSGLQAQASFLVRTNWSQFHFDNAHTGFNPFENVLGVSNVGGLVQKWAVATASGASADPVVSGGLVYVAPADGVVRALDPASGATVWSYDTGGAMTGAAPAVSAGVLYVGNEAGALFALGATTGRLIWSVDLGYGVYQAPVVAGTQVYVNTDRLNAVDQGSGAILWKGSGGYLAPAAMGNVVYSDVFTIGATIVARGAQHGRLLWSNELCDEGCDMGAPTVADARALFMVDNQLTALDQSTGTFLWDSDAGYTHGGPVLAGGVAYTASETPTITAWDETHGTMLWQQDGPGTGTEESSMALANGVLYVGSDDGFLWGYNASTGAVLWQSAQVPAAVKGSPAVSDGVVYVGSDDGTVYAFGLP